MNSRERIMSVLSGTAPDHRAYAMTLSLYGARLTHCPLSVYFSDAHRYVKGQTAIHEAFAPDVLFGPFAFAQLGASFGGKLKYFEDQAPVLRETAGRNAKDLTLMPIPDPETCPHLQYHCLTISELVEKCGNETPIAAILPFPIDLPSLIIGMDAWIESILFDPEGTQEVIEIITPFLVDLANLIYENGADFIVSPCAFSSPSMVTRGIATSFARPVLEQTLRQLHGPVVLHHGGAPVLPHLDLLTNLPNVVGYVVDARDNLARAREIIGPDKILFSGPSNLSLPDISADEVTRRCSAVLADRSSDPRFVLCNSGPDVPFTTAPANICAFRDSARSSGGVCQ